MTDPRMSVYPVEGIGEVERGADVGSLISKALETSGTELVDGDVVVVTQKIISKAEGRIATLGSDEGAKLRLVERESRRIVRRRGDLVIAETPHGFICANAGVDSSNIAPGKVTLLPEDPDRSARRIHKALTRSIPTSLGVIISDTFGRAWRIGQTNVAIGIAGIEPIRDHRGAVDSYGNDLVATQIAVADELAAAAELVMRKSDGVPAVVVRGSGVRLGNGSTSELIRPPIDDLFR